MSFWQNILSSVTKTDPGVNLFTPRVTHLGATEVQGMLDPATITAAQMWRTQPHFRTVITFVARNIAQLGLHTFERQGETDRVRSRDSSIARALAEVDGQMTPYEMIYTLVGDLLLYDRGYWLTVPSAAVAGGFMLRRLPPTWVEPVYSDPWTVGHYVIHVGDGKTMRLKADEVLAFPGYAPGNSHGSSPTVDALRETLQEQVESARYRGQIWKRGGRVSSVLQRPLDAPEWSSDARSKFREDWYAKYTGTGGSHAGGTPILEDGMTLQRIDFNAQEQQYVEAAKLSLVTVASAFHVNPTMIGQNEGATYSNVREFRKMLYGDTLGPLIAQIESRVNTFLVPRLEGAGADRFYVEFNIEEKLQGNFEEQSQALQSATGAPWMTRNEARGIRNLPGLEGGDELVTPLNVLEGGQASPNDSGSQNLSGPVQRSMGLALPGKARAKGERYEIKAEPTDEQAKAAQEMLSAFFARQGKAIQERLGAGDDEWWDGERWDAELSDEILAVASQVSAYVGEDVAQQLGFSEGDYNVEDTLAFLGAVSERIAGQVNSATRFQVEDAIEGGEDGAVEHVFDVAADSRAESSADTLTTTFAGFAALEAARQLAASSTRKRWQVNSANPRESHAAVDGEEVGLDEDFSNGMPWPGSIEGDVDEVAGCECSIIIVSD